MIGFHPIQSAKVLEETCLRKQLRFILGAKMCISARKIYILAAKMYILAAKMEKMK